MQDEQGEPNVAQMHDAVSITAVRVSNFRSLQNVEVQLENLTVLLGANNSGKSTFLDAMNMALGLLRKNLGPEDIYISSEDALPPKDRKILVDVMLRPVTSTNRFAKHFPQGSYWTGLWGEGISQDTQFHDFMAYRTTLAWDEGKGEYSITKRFLKEWLEFPQWLKTEEKEDRIGSAQIEPIALHYIDAKRDLDDDLRRPNSFWRRLTDDLGLKTEDIEAVENALSSMNQSIIDKSDVLKHIKSNLSDLQQVVVGDGSGVEIAPVARRLRDLSKGVDISFSSQGSQPFPVTRHGMGTRSLASLLVFRAFVSWKSGKASQQGDHIHPVLALEEPEAHLHPQAQRALYAQIESIPGQRLVSTHSPYFAGQADLSALRLFLKEGSKSTVRHLNLGALQAEEIGNIERRVLASRGDLLFSRALLLFEGETEEQALPLWAETYWNATVHELGFSFVPVGGGAYFPFVWLAQELGIRWYIFSDGEEKPVNVLKKQLKKAGIEDVSKCPNVMILPNGNDFEKQLISENYANEIESALDVLFGKGYVGQYVKDMHGEKKKGGGTRDYESADGKYRALLDMLRESKTFAAAAVARQISQCSTASRQVPMCLQKVLAQIGRDFNLKTKFPSP